MDTHSFLANWAVGKAYITAVVADISRTADCFGLLASKGALNNLNLIFSSTLPAFTDAVLARVMMSICSNMFFYRQPFEEKQNDATIIANCHNTISQSSDMIMWIEIHAVLTRNNSHRLG